jgi:uncharacterized protein (TIGR00255 family)
MTGFGKTKLETNNKVISLEIRSLNSKQLDMNLRIPHLYREKELELRGIIGSQLIRGKIDFFINIEQSSVDSAPQINTSIVKHYYNQLKSLTEELDINANNDFLASIMKMPDIITSTNEELKEQEWKDIVETLNSTLQKVNEFRAHEGALLFDDFKKRIGIIKKLLKEVEPFEKARIPHIKERIQANIKSMLEEVTKDNDRLEQEMIFYLEKLDITEEKVRLLKHCDYFLETIDKEEIAGKKLGFVSQEIGREINTLGSKANDADIQKIVVLMKDELEKIKEQLFNIL